MASDPTDSKSKSPDNKSAADAQPERPRSRWERPMPPMGKVRRGPRRPGLRGRGERRDAPEGRRLRPEERGVDERKRVRPGDRLRKGGFITVTPKYYLPQGFAQAEERGRKIAVWGGIVGERADVRVQHVGQNRIRARFAAPAKGTEASAHRVLPVCDKYDACGSCPLMHLDAAGQADARLAILRRSLEGAGLAEHMPEELVTIPEGEHEYRHVAKLAIGRSDHGNIRVGAYRRGSHDIVAIPDCHVVTPGLRAAMRVTAHAVIDLELGPWEPDGRDGPLRHIVLRQSRTSGEVLATIVAGESARGLSELARRMGSADAEIVGVHLHFNAKRGNSIFDYDPEEADAPGFTRLNGARTITEEVAGMRLDIGPGDFFQANPAMGARLVETALEWLEPWRDRPVVDLYCGVGAFSVPLGDAHGRVLGIEMVGGAVQRAEENARRNRVSAEFVSGRVSELLLQRSDRLKGKGAVVVADPARRGLEEGVLDAVFACEPAAMLLVSCNPAAFARDLKALVKAGWDVLEVGAFDLFPQTVHLEVMALLTPPEAPELDGRAPQRRMVR